MKYFHLIAFLSLLLMSVGCESSAQLSEDIAQSDTLVKKNSTDQQSIEESTPENFPEDSLFLLDSTWRTESGSKFEFSELSGKISIIAMAYTTCQYACPRIIADMKQIESTLSAEVESDIEFVLASLDSAHDTPEVLKKFKNEKSLDENWTLLHGDEMAVRNLAAVLGMKFKQTDNGKDFSHSAILTVLDSKGRINHQRLGFGSSVEETLEQVKLLISSN